MAYDGTRFAGFQRQAGSTPTIQSELEGAIASVTRQQATVTAAGRTDAGVHATGQIIAFDCEWRHPVEALWRAINATLPPEIALQDLSEAEAGFHPRFDAASRCYVYRFYAAPVRNPVFDRMCWYTGNKPLDLEAMQQAADLMIGTHDFATFGQPPQGEVTIREMKVAQIETAEDGTHRFLVEANAFLKHMVRSLMGTLVEVGMGKLSVAQFEAALLAADRSQAGQTAPPHGLTLVQVKYRGENPSEKFLDENQDLDTQSDRHQ